jgi:cytochrome c
VNSIAFSADGTRLLTGGYDGKLRVWRVGDGHPAMTIPGHDFGVNSVALALQGGLFASASVDGSIRLWDPATGREAAVLWGHEGAVMAVAVAGKGAFVASGGLDGKVRIWRRADGGPIFVIEAHDGPVWSLSFPPDGRLLLSAGADDLIKVWDVTRGTEVGKREDQCDGASQETVAAQPSIGPGGERGASLFRKCSACHTVTPDGEYRAGPTLYGLFGRQAAAIADYPYSDALRRSGLVWNEDTVDDLFELGPESFIPGTKMPLQSMPSAEDRALLIDYLKEITAPGPAN